MRGVQDYTTTLVALAESRVIQVSCLCSLLPVQGYIYIEAYKESHVKDAVRGLRNIYLSKAPKLVPVKEMVDAITVNRKAKAMIGTVQVFTLPARAATLVCLPHLSSWHPTS